MDNSIWGHPPLHQEIHKEGYLVACSMEGQQTQASALISIQMETNKMQTLWKVRSMYQDGAFIQESLAKMERGKEKQSVYWQMAVYSLETTMKT